MLIIYKVPYIFDRLMLLITLIATISFIYLITQNNELLIIISSGISPIKIILIPIIISTVFSSLILAINGSLSPYFLQRYKLLESRIKGSSDMNLIVSSSGIFFSEKFADEHRIVQVRSIDVNNKLLEDVTIIVADADSNFVERIDAKKAFLESGFYKFVDAFINRQQKFQGWQDTEYIKDLRVPTTLKVENLRSQFEQPRSIDFWVMPKVIKRFKKLGLNTSKYKLHYYRELLKPLGCAAMALIACCFITLNTRSELNKYVLMLGIVVGIMTFLLYEISINFMIYSGFSPLMSVLVPLIVILSLAIFVVLHLHEA